MKKHFKFIVFAAFMIGSVEVSYADLVLYKIRMGTLMYEEIQV